MDTRLTGIYVMRRILAVGELNADLIMSGLPSLPVLGQELLGTGFQMTMGSSSGITDRCAVGVVDTTGAGDAFNAGCVWATVVKQAAPPDALRFAVACGAQAVTQVGGQPMPRRRKPSRRTFPRRLQCDRQKAHAGKG
jgi:hypothetical protein